MTLLTHGETAAKDHVAADWQAPEPHYAAPRGMQVSPRMINTEQAA